MSDSFSFTVYGPPVPKARARGCSDGKHRTPKKTRDYEALVRRIASLHVPAGWSLDGSFELTTIVYFANARRADWSNVAKTIEDALNKTAYHDDSQIVGPGYGSRKDIDRDNPRVEIVVRRVS